jgi:DNA ligase (NAD+)
MKKSEAKLRIDKLVREIEEHNNRYYVLNQPSISDFEFDILLNELSALEKKFPEFVIDGSPTGRVGSDITREFEQYEHLYQLNMFVSLNSMELQSAFLIKTANFSGL